MPSPSDHPGFHARIVQDDHLLLGVEEDALVVLVRCNSCGAEAMTTDWEERDDFFRAHMHGTEPVPLVLDPG